MDLNTITKGLYAKCFAMSTKQHIIMSSHLPFEDGFYVTEYDVVLKVCKRTIYVLTESGWEEAPQFFKLWYDSMTNFADIPAEMVKRMGLGNLEGGTYGNKVMEVVRGMYAYYDEKEKEYERRLSAYFSSEESRMLKRTGDSPWEISEDLYNVAIFKLEELLNVKGENIPDEVKKTLQKEMCEVVNDLQELVRKVVKQHWRPLILLSGEPGEYNDLLYYDEELNLMVVYEPDDNYYHWGGYECYVGIPTKDRSRYDREKEIRYVYCPVNYSSIEFDFSERNEQRYRVWDKFGKEIICRWRK